MQAALSNMTFGMVRQHCFHSFYEADLAQWFGRTKGAAHKSVRRKQEQGLS